VSSPQQDARSLGGEDERLIEALQRREERAFAALVDGYHESLLRFARVYVPSNELAEEAVQETWIAVLRGIDRFEGRSSLKTWLFRILMNRARSLVRREERYVSFAAGFDPAREPGEPAVDPARFLGGQHPTMPGHWSDPPRRWIQDPETEMLTREVLELVERAIADLPPSQREVITLRDIEGWSALEVCNVLEITETNQRVLLHRARSRVRDELDQYLASD
jgi:RNA polymerase sigma-70 factor (ECF subfamily)